MTDRIGRQTEREFKWSLNGNIRYRIPTPSDRTGHNARYVLGFGLAGAIIALTVLYLFYFVSVEVSPS